MSFLHTIFNMAQQNERRCIKMKLFSRYIYCSSAGVYLKSDVLPHCEVHSQRLYFDDLFSSSSPSCLYVDLTNNLTLLPLKVDAVDPKSRHKGKLETESLLDSKGVNWTSIRPVYIYGPLNYNPVEEWFFHRLKAGRPIPIPGSGVQITQLGHVKVSCSSS